MTTEPAGAEIVLVGGGNMGRAMLDGWLAGGAAAASIVVVEPDAANAALVAARGVAVVPDPHRLEPLQTPAVVVVAVKPAVVDMLLPAYAPFAGHGAAVLSIAAGKTTARLSLGLGEQAAIIRAMPNTPASIRRGITVAYANAYVSQTQHARCEELLAAIGAVVWIEEEGLLDAVTAVSGSGPAYVFLLAEELARAGVEAGLPSDLAERLARETVVGAGALLSHSPLTAGTLRANVTSPGGTTAAALAVLMADDGLQPLLTRAVTAATRRAGELAG